MPGLTLQIREERQYEVSLLPNIGCASKERRHYLKAAEVAKFRAAITRGKLLSQLECEQQLQEHLQHLEAQAKELGLELPE